jgi:hypothetical protein
MATRKKRIDFTGVENYGRISEGYHKVKIAKVDEGSSQSGNDMLRVTFEVISGEDKGGKVFENYTLIDTALWKLKGLLQAIGMKADGRVQIDLDRMVGKTLEILVSHEEYNGQLRARVSETNKIGSKSASETDEDEDDDEDIDEPKKPAKTAKKSTRKTSKKSEPDLDEEDEDEDMEEDDDWDDEDEDEEEQPKAKKKTTSSAKKNTSKTTEKKSTRKPVKKEEPDDDDDDDWNDDDDWSDED